jgi:hypothetical protein
MATTNRIQAITDSVSASSRHDRRSAHPPPLDLVALPRLPIAELRELWPVHFGRARMPTQRRILIRELAWRYQERLYGGLDAQTRRLLDAAVRDAMKRRLSSNRRSDVEGDQLPPRRLRRSPAPSAAQKNLARVPAGSKLIRTWPERSKTTHEVTILDGGKVFEYRGERYKSLSEVARLITGTRWSGPRFFGLASKRRSEGGAA